MKRFVSCLVMMVFLVGLARARFPEFPPSEVLARAAQTGRAALSAAIPRREEPAYVPARLPEAAAPVPTLLFSMAEGLA